MSNGSTYEKFTTHLHSLSSDKEQLVEEEDDELKEVLDLRKIAVQLLQQEQQNRCVCVCLLIDCTAYIHFLTLKTKFFSVFKKQQDILSFVFFCQP